MASLPTTIAKSDTYTSCMPQLSSLVVSFFYDDLNSASMQYPQGSRLSQTFGTNIDLQDSEDVDLPRARFDSAISVLSKRTGGTAETIIGIIVTVLVVIGFRMWLARRHNRIILAQS